MAQRHEFKLTEVEVKTPKRFNGSQFNGWPLVLLLCGFMWLVIKPGTTVEAIHCTSRQHADSVDVVMLSAQWCTYCSRARRFLVSEGINYCEHDIERSEIGRDLYAQSQVKVIPIIHIENDTLVGFSKNEILQTLASYDLYPLEDI